MQFLPVLLLLWSVALAGKDSTYASFPSLTAMWKGVNPLLFFSSRQEVLYWTNI